MSQVGLIEYILNKMRAVAEKYVQQARIMNTSIY